MFSTARDHDLILIIDDDGSTPHPLNEILGAQAHLIFAHDGARGLDLAAREKPELILLNAQLPGLDGYAICRALLADTRTAPAPSLL